MKDCLETFITDSLRRPMSQHELLESLEATLAQALSRLVLLGTVVAAGTMPERYVLTSHHKAPEISPDALREGWHAGKHTEHGPRWRGKPCRLCGSALSDANTFPSQRGKSRMCKDCMMRGKRVG